jgi:serine/threonine protein kinase/WD40 repeat protein
MSEGTSGPDLLNELAHEFAQRYRHGERPALTEYTDRYPELAAQIRDLFPALVVMEEFGSVAGAPLASRVGSSGPGVLKLPRQLGEYRLLREVGRGGMGIVYEAVQESLGRHVALKVLPFHSLISPTHRERFEREARAAARLHHSNIVPVFGIGEEEGLHYYVMQFIQGQGLDAVLKEVRCLRTGREAKVAPALTVSIAHSLLTNRFDGPVGEAQTGGRDVEPSARNAREAVARTEHVAGVGSLAEGPASGLNGPSEIPYFRGVARLGVQVAEALAYTHRQGIVHRDIKPSNLLLDTQGVVWVTDFGLVKDEGSDDLTSPGDLVGTVRYMAPERLEGQGDYRSDLYCLGVTLYEMLTLRPPFEDAQRARLTERILHEEPVRPRKHDPRIPRDLETVVLKSMAKDPAQRYSTAEELAEDLRRFLADRPILARRTSLVERSWRWCRRNRAVAGLAGFVLLLLCVIAGVKSASLVQLQEQLRQTQLAEADKTERLWDAYLAQAQASRWSGRVGRRFEGLEAVAKAAAIHTDLRLRNEAIGLFALRDMRPFKQLPEGIPAASTGLTFDPNFKRYAYGDGQGNLRVCRLADDQELVALPGFGRHAFGLEFTPDGQFLAAYYHGENSLRVWDLRQRKVVLHKPIYGHADFSPRRPLAVVPQPDGSLGLYDLDTANQIRRLPTGPGPAFCTVSPDGRQLAVSSGHDPCPRIFDVETGILMRTVPQKGNLVWNADGSLAAVQASEGIYVWNTRTWTPQAALNTPDSVTQRVAFNCDGDVLASAGWDDILRLWDPLSGSELLRRHGARDLVQFSRDGRLLAGTFDGMRFQVWEVSHGLACRHLHLPQSPSYVTWHAAFSPDGRLLACACSDGVRLWDVAAGRVAAQLETSGVTGGALFLVDESLITASGAGVLHWPIRPGRGAGAGSLTVGPPRLLSTLAPTGVYSVSLCPNGKIAAIARDKGQIIILDPYNPSDQQVLSGHSFVTGDPAISSDGRWLAAPTYWDMPQDKLRVSDLRTGQIACTLPVQTAGAFSPDGRWLATVGDMCRLWETGTWRFARSIPREAPLGRAIAIAFSPDCTTLAIAYDAQVVRLVNPDSGQELATLAAPDSQRPVYKLCFSPDGSQLAGVMGNAGVQLWDLRLLRRQLGDLGLDWDAPPYPPVKAAPPAEPLSVTVEAAKAPAPPASRAKSS